jgi:Ca2+-dependent lipid-binding protein
VIILKSSGRSCEVKLGTSNEVVIRDIKFDSEKDRTSFEKVMDKLSTLEHERAQRQVAAYKSIKKDTERKPQEVNRKLMARALSMSEEGTDTINLLVEIVSAIDIPVADMYSSDAYVIVRMGGNEVHRTNFIPKSLDPIWTLNSGSLFLLQMTPEDFFSCAGGMSFTVKDYDAVGGNETLGRVTLTLDELLHGTGERHGYDIVEKVLGEKNHGKLYLRYKEATREDIEVSNESLLWKQKCSRWCILLTVLTLTLCCYGATLVHDRLPR